MAKVVFLFNGKELAIQCTKEDKMKDICNKFAIKVDININSLLFIYGGNKINYELTFKQHASSMDNNINEMKILVYKSENDEFKCKKCGETIHLDILDNIIKYNNEQKDILIEMKNQIDNIIKLNNISDIIKKIKLIKIILDSLISQNEKSLKDIQNDLNNSDTIETKNNDYNFQIIKEYQMNSETKKYLKYIIEKSYKQCSNYLEIATCIQKYCDNNFTGEWSVIVGDKDKYYSVTHHSQMIGGYIGSYKILIFSKS